MSFISISFPMRMLLSSHTDFSPSSWYPHFVPSHTGPQSIRTQTTYPKPPILTYINPLPSSSVPQSYSLEYPPPLGPVLLSTTLHTLVRTLHLLTLCPLPHATCLPVNAIFWNRPFPRHRIPRLGTRLARYSPLPHPHRCRSSPMPRLGVVLLILVSSCFSHW